MCDIARGIKTARLNAGLTQEGLATAAGVTVRALRSWEHEEREMTLRSAIMLADALDLSLDALIQREVTQPFR